MINCGVALSQEAWTSTRVEWEIEPKHKIMAKALPSRPTPSVTYPHMDRTPMSILIDHPVDVIVIDDSWDK